MMSFEHLARCVLDRFPAPSPGAGLALAVLRGDPLAPWVLRDFLEEEGYMEQPFEVGKSYLICTVTLYYVGRVESAGFAWLRLADASWVHWTGRLSSLLAHHDFKHPSLARRKPRVEPCGQAIVATSSIVAAYPWTGKLPKEAVE